MASAARSEGPERAAMSVSIVENASTATCPTKTGQASGVRRRALSHKVACGRDAA